ncbi:MAG TPA: energy transducer TonB [Pseudoxanthomonas sp.]|nr:energy transducer TonB [Pseudoxanthomonas sp.]
MVRTLQVHAQPRPEPARILAIAAAIAVHVLAFLLLLLPLANTPLNIVPAEPPPVSWQIPVQIQPPPLPPEPVEKPQQRRSETATPQTVPRTPVAQNPVTVDQGTLPAETLAPAIETGTTEGIDIGSGTRPMTGAQLAYATAPAPDYPRDAAKIGAQGTVLLMVLVDTDGTPLEVTLHKSSGNRSLDRAAAEQVLKRWRFQPAMREGRAVQAYGVVPIAFTMQ